MNFLNYRLNSLKDGLIHFMGEQSLLDKCYSVNSVNAYV